MLKRGLLFLLVFIILVQNNLAQECLIASEENVPQYAQNLLQIFSTQEAALDSLDRWTDDGGSGWLAYKKEIRDEMRRSIKADGELEKILQNYIDDEWYNLIRGDLIVIEFLSEKTGVPAEAILAAIFVEDLRYHGPDFKSKLSLSFAKAQIRKSIPNPVLAAFGHNPNAASGYSNYGTVHYTTYDGAKEYLLSLNGLDQGTKEILLAEFHLTDDFPRTQNFLMSMEISKLAIVLKAHMEYWKLSGFDLFTYDFETIDSFGERVGILETLNSISAYYSGNLYNVETNSWVEPGFYTGGFVDGEKRHVSLTRRIIPSNAPQIGGSEMWGWTDYGTISRVFIDSGLAEDLLKRSREEVALSN